MWRFLAGVGSALLLIGAGFFIWTGMAQEDTAIPPAPEAEAEVPVEPGRPARPPSADERTKEQRRFDRADRDNDGRVTLAELLYPRQRPFQRLDTNRDGKLSFEEWAVRTRTKFGDADANRDGILTRQEYATTAPRPRAPTKAANCRC
jgi:EF hand